MGRWRVGTLSMGVVLIAAGVLLLTAQFSGKAAVETAVKWWPLILVLLGGEVLWYSYSAKEESPKVKYDIFSIFIILVILVFSLGVQGLTEIGLIPQVSRIVSAQHYSLKIPQQEFPISEEIKKVVIEGPQQCNFTVRTGSGNTVIAFGNAYVVADTQDTAEKMLAENGAVFGTSGETLYISFNLSLQGSELGYHVRVMDYTLIIPENKQVEVKHRGYTLALIVDSLQNDWIVEGGRNTEIRLSSQANVKVIAEVSHESGLGGNAKWEIKRKGETDQGLREIRGEAVFGSGEHAIYVYQAENVAVNQLN